LKYRPVHQFDGYTECFNEAALLDLSEYLDDISDPLAGVVDYSQC
jgi:hypothetical protein